MNLTPFLDPFSTFLALAEPSQRRYLRALSYRRVLRSALRDNLAACNGIQVRQEIHPNYSEVPI